MNERVNLDWSKLGFGYIKTPYRFQAEWEDGQWSEGCLVEDDTIPIEEGSCALNYGQACFEGLKCFSGPEGQPLLFRPEENAARMARSAERLMMPPPPRELFLGALEEVIRANLAWLPPHGTGASMYLRPLMVGVGANLGLRPASRYVFRVFCCPVGPYFAGGFKGIRLATTTWDRTAPNGTGAYKVAGNYAGGLLATRQAKDAGFDEALYLDASEHYYLEEAGSANVYGVQSRPGTSEPLALVTPKSSSILPSITMKSVLEIAQEDMGLRVDRRIIAIDEVPAFSEMGCTGTAAVITPVLGVHHDGKDIATWEEPGPVTRELYEQLTGIQDGRIEDRRGWVYRVPSESRP